jgi:hypothetical protein
MAKNWTGWQLNRALLARQREYIESRPHIALGKKMLQEYPLQTLPFALVEDLMARKDQRRLRWKGTRICNG